MDKLFEKGKMLIIAWEWVRIVFLSSFILKINSIPMF